MINNGHYIKAAPIIYIRPKSSIVTTSWLTGDYGWRLANAPDTYVPPTYGIPALLDSENPFKLKNNNAFGHKWRYTGLYGGYYNIDDLKYYTSAGTVDAETVFGSGNNAYLIDHHTGLGYKWTPQSAANFTGLVSSIQTLNCTGFTDFQLCSVEEIMSLYCVGSNINQFYPSNNYFQPWSPYNQSLKLCDNYPPNPTGSTFQFSTGQIIVNRAITANDGGIPVRYHYK